MHTGLAGPGRWDLRRGAGRVGGRGRRARRGAIVWIVGGALPWCGGVASYDKKGADRDR